MFRLFPLDGLPDRVDCAFFPLTFTQFSEYFLVPYFACRLIEEDQTVNFAVAYDIMLDSQAFGSVIHEHDEEEDDQEVDNVVHSMRGSIKVQKLLDYPSITDPWYSQLGPQERINQ